MNIKKHFIMHVFSFVAMFVTMYAMIDTFGHFYININKAYMSLLMVAAMVLVNTMLMPQMYQSSKIRFGFLFAGILSTVGLVLMIRSQALVGNVSFLRSMIPHHSSAILMCQEAKITDPEIEELCGEIIEAQVDEINQMKTILNKYN